MTEDEARAACVNLDALHRLGHVVEGFDFSWRTRPTDTGWHATLDSSFNNGGTPRWGGDGPTEAAALDKAAGHTLYYWTQTAGALKRAWQALSEESGPTPRS